MENLQSTDYMIGFGILIVLTIILLLLFRKKPEKKVEPTFFEDKKEPSAVEVAPAPIAPKITWAQRLSLGLEYVS